MDYGWLALLPPVVAIGFALWKRQVILSMLVGIFTGALIINIKTGVNPARAVLDTFSVYIVEKSLADSWNIGIIVFLLAVGGMIGMIGKMGGTKAIAVAIAQKAKGVRSTQLATALMGVAIFFDDYANSIVVGNTMRPITDEKRISREKLAYIVDSSAAPISSMAPVSTWIAMELGLIAAGLVTVNISDNSMMVFFQTIPYRFYSLFALILLFTLIIQRRDFGPMLKAEIRARKTGKVFADGTKPMITEDETLLPGDDVKGSIWEVIIPITVFLIVTVLGLWLNGWEEGKNFKDSMGDADASVALTWAAFIGSMTAALIGLVKKKFTLSESVDAWIAGAKTMFVALVIIALAFALKSVITEMKLDEWLGAASTKYLQGEFLPLIVFIVAMIMAFSIGSSWGTNAILMPIVIPVAASVSAANGSLTPLIVASIGSVLTGAVFGDHCSPISDTTILSSSASGSDHVDHVKTQIPYALTAAGFAIVFGFLPVGFGMNPWIGLVLGTAGIILFVRFVGKRIDEKGDVIS